MTEREREKVRRGADEWRRVLTPEQYRVAREGGTERAFTGEHWDRKDAGLYRCVCCGEPLFSSRTKSGERTNGENLLGSRQSDGRFYLVMSGDEYFGDNVWPAFDWTRLPGTTVEQKADTADDTYGYGKSTFAGGTGDGRNGVSAMELVPLNSSLTAKKAWFFFDDVIVFLGIVVLGGAAGIWHELPVWMSAALVVFSGGRMSLIGLATSASSQASSPDAVSNDGGLGPRAKPSVVIVDERPYVRVILDASRGPGGGRWSLVSS